MSFNTDLAFFERVALGAARSLGARVTVISDADYVTIDPRAVRGAGRTYLDGRALCRSGGALHAKLLAIARADAATVAIGSGNATMAGWHGNAEIWTVLKTTDDGSSRALVALGRWLVELPSELRLSQTALDAMTRVGNLVAGLPERIDGPSLVTSLHQPIVDQLPDGPVDELVLFAPFYDPAGSALDALVRRMKPRRVEICLQAKQGSFNGASLSAATHRVDSSFIAVDEDRYYHGKLIEWRTGNQRHALVGSPNLSSAALLRSMSSGGNCELALVTPLEGSLQPPTDEVVARDAVELLAVNIDEYEPRPLGPSLLEATLQPAGVRLALARPLDSQGHAEVGGEAWSPIGPVPPGERSVLVLKLLEPGSPVRLVDAAGVASQVVLATDPDRILRTSVAGSTRRDVTEEDLFEDPQAFLQFHRDVLALREHLQSRGVPAASSPTAQPTARPPAFVSWEDRLRIYEDHLGPDLTRYGLALPRLASAVGGSYVTEVLEPGTSDPDSRDDEEDSIEVDTSGLDLRNHSEALRHRYRRWCDELSQLVPTLPPAARVIAVRLILRAAAGGLWERRTDWLTSASRAVEHLAAPGTEFDSEKESLASTAAVALSILRGQIWDVWEETSESQSVSRATRAIRPLLPFRSATSVRVVSDELLRDFGLAADPIIVEELANQLEKDDPLGDAIAVSLTAAKPAIVRAQPW